jgi:sulfopropanediol 3-dehydrogenase
VVDAHVRFLKQAVPVARADRSRVEDTVREMLSRIETERDEAVRHYARALDKWESPEFRVSPDTIRDTAARLPETFKDDFAVCLRNVTAFARLQRESLREFESEISPGTVLGQKQIPIAAAGCYIPGGKYPLISAAIMSVATAKAAGVGHIIGCAPPRDASGIFPATLYALHASGADEIFCLGGVQAMASMAYGCLGMPPADIITGPGNAYVAEAKRQLFGVAGIDLLAGPTEILVIADASADPDLVALDLIGQAEHGPDSPAWLITTSEAFGRAVIERIEQRLQTLATREMAEPAWRNRGEVAVVSDDDAAIALSDQYAPEHLEVQTARNDYYLGRLRNYGSLFLGEESTVAYGDKGVGTNHTLPTGRAARYTGGLWVGKFIKTVTYQRLTADASRALAPVMARMCEAEGMIAHAATCDVRFARYAPPNVRPPSEELPR